MNFLLEVLFGLFSTVHFFGKKLDDDDDADADDDDDVDDVDGGTRPTISYTPKTKRHVEEEKTRQDKLEKKLFSM